MIFGPGTVCVPTLDDLINRDPPADIALSVTYRTADGTVETADMSEVFIKKYRYRMIGDCNADRWLQKIADRRDSIALEASERLTIYMQAESSFASLEAGSAEYEDIMLREEMPFSMPVSLAGKQYVKSRDTHTVKSKNFQDLNTSTAKQAMEDVPSFEKWYTSQFEDLFFGRWR